VDWELKLERVEEGDGVSVLELIGFEADIRLCGGGFFVLPPSKKDCAREHKSLLTPLASLLLVAELVSPTSSAGEVSTLMSKSIGGSFFGLGQAIERQGVATETYVP
jgi:hypothetical protein